MYGSMLNDFPFLKVLVDWPRECQDMVPFKFDRDVTRCTTWMLNDFTFLKVLVDEI